MTTRVIQASGVWSVRYGPHARSRAAYGPSWLAIRLMAAVVILMLALCVVATTASWAVAGTPPAQGPEPGLDL